MGPEKEREIFDGFVGGEKRGRYVFHTKYNSQWLFEIKVAIKSKWRVSNKRERERGEDGQR